MKRHFRNISFLLIPATLLVLAGVCTCWLHREKVSSENLQNELVRFKMENIKKEFRSQLFRHREEGAFGAVRKICSDTNQVASLCGGFVIVSNKIAFTRGISDFVDPKSVENVLLRGSPEDEKKGGLESQIVRISSKGDLDYTFSEGGHDYQVVTRRFLRIRKSEAPLGGPVEDLPYSVDEQFGLRRGMLAGIVLDYRKGLSLGKSGTIYVLSSGALIVLALVGVYVTWLLWRARRDLVMKERFLSNVAHELRTPLTGVALQADRLARGTCQTGERIQRAADVIQKEATRMGRLVTDLLDLARIDNGRRIYQREDFDLVEVAQGVVEDLRDRFEENGITVKADPELPVVADQDAARRIIVNLLTNAAKYAADAGPVEVVAIRAGTRARVSVLDHGPGLSSAARRKVFDRFWRGGDSATKNSGGMGIGLNISRTNARNMGGDLTVAERPGGGCVFTLELNLDPAYLEEEANENG